MHHSQRGEGIEAAAHSRAGDLRFLAKLGNGQALPLWGKRVKDFQPARQGQHKVRVVFRLADAESIWFFFAHTPLFY